MPHWTGILIVLVLVLLLFGGRGKVSSLMGDMAKGITAFRKGLREGDEDEESDPADEAIDITPPKSKAKSKAKK